MRISLQHKLLGSFILVVTLVMISVSVGVSILIRDYFIASKKREFTDKAYETARVVEGYYTGQINYGQMAGFINNIDSLLGARVWVLDNSFTIIAASEEQQTASGFRHRGGMKKSPLGAARDCEPMAEHQSGMMQHGNGMGMHMGRQSGRQAGTLDNTKEQQPVRNIADLSGMAAIKEQLALAGSAAWDKTFYHPYYEENMLVVGVPLSTGEEVRGMVLIHAPLAGFDDFLNRIYWYLAAAGAVAIFITVFIANYLSAGIIRPLKSMQAVAALMAGGDYSARVKVANNDEVGDVSRSLSALGQALTEFVSQTEKTDKLRRDFVANVSHELRTPVTIIRGYTEALLDQTVTGAEQAAKYYQIMRDEAIRLERLVAGLLDLSQLEARTTALQAEQVSISELAENVVAMFNRRASDKEVKLTGNITGETTLITGDGDRITQLMVILLDNALKFTPAGGAITVGVEAAAEGVILRIADTGNGIAAEDLPYIWERFYKADKAHTRVAGGTGLGLAIAREIIHLHGAEAEVASVSGQGTAFTIRFRR